MGTLYLVATPIGNLEDITLRALRVLKESPLIAAEDTRRTRLLLKHYDISTALTSYYEHNKLSKLEYILSRLETQDVALVSEAGMPGISDPGYELVRTAIERGITVAPIPGASAVLSALAVSGLPTDQFVYLGFLPRKSGERRRRLASVATHSRSIVAFESPHRLLTTLSDIENELGDRQIVVGREMTKLYEEFVRGPVSEVREHFQAHPPRGEITVIISGVPKQKPSSRAVVDASGLDN